MRAYARGVAACLLLLLGAGRGMAAEIPPLVPEGEPDQMLGVSWKAGRPSFRNAARGPAKQNAVAFSPDGKSLASASNDKTVRLWDPKSGRLVRTLDGHSQKVLSVAFGPDSKSLASASADKTVRLWDANTGRLLRTLEGHAHSVLSVAFSPDGKSLASASDDETVRLWDATSGRLLRTLEGHSDSVLSVAFSPDGKSLASASDDKTVRLWDANTGSPLRILEGHSHSVESVAFNPDGKSLASASFDGTVRLWDASTGGPLRTLHGHSSTLESVTFSPDGRSLASASHDKTVLVWDATTGRLLRTLAGHFGDVLSLAFSPDGKSLASVGGTTVRVWDASTGRLLRTLDGHSNLVASVALSPDGKKLASASFEEPVRLWDLSTGRLLRTLDGHSKWVLSVAFSPDGKSLASAGEDKTVRVWDTSTGRLLHTLEGHSDSVWSVVFSPDGKSVASAGLDETVRVWDATTGRLLHTLAGHSNRVWSVAFGPNDKSLASASGDKTVRLWDAKTGRLLRTLVGHSNLVLSVTFSPDGKSLASASEDKTVRLWDASTGKLLRTLGHSKSVLSVAFSPDGKSLASASGDKTVRLWDASTGRLLRTLEGHSRYVRSVTFSPDGKSLASVSGDGTTRVWHRRGDLMMVLWSGRDGWVAWRAGEAPERRMLRGENGNLVVQRMDEGAQRPIPPDVGDSPRIEARAEITRPAKQGEMGEIAVRVHNAAGASPAIWLEVTGLVAPETSNFVIRPSQILMRLEPGAEVDLPVEYIRHQQDNPAPDKAKVVLALHHAFDHGKPIEVPIDLVFQAPQIVPAVQSPSREGDGLTVPLSVTNKGDQATGCALAINALFQLPDGHSFPSESKAVLDEGLKPGDSKDLSIKVPKDVVKAKSFDLRLTVNEGMGPGMPADSREAGYLSTWTFDEKGLKPPVFWQLYLLLGLALSIAGSGTYFVRVYRHPVVVATGKDPKSLLQGPLRSLPKASAALARVRRLDAVLGSLGISNKRWTQVLGVASDARKAVETLLLVLGAEPGQAIPGTAAVRAKLPSLRVRFGPEVAMALLSGPRTEPGEAQRLTEAAREAGLAALVLLDLTDSENGLESFKAVARFTGVVLASAQLRDVLLAANPLSALEHQIASQRPLREISPYRTAGGVEEAALFFGRAEELRKLADRDLQNAILVGARQMGKSSLLKALARRLGTRSAVDVRYVVLASDDLIGEIAAALDRPRPDSIAAFQDMVRGEKARPRVWLIDEADKFAQADLAAAKPGEISWALRALAEEGTTYFVLTGFWELFRAAVFTADSPIRNLGELIRLGPLDAEAAAMLVRDPMAALRISVADEAVAGILRETGCRANLLVLACQGLLERTGPEQQTLTAADLQAVWNDHAALREALMYWKDAPLDRAVGHAALALDQPTRRDIETRLEASGIHASAAELDQTFERLELGYVLLRQADPDGGVDRWACPIPLIPRFEKRIMSWDEHLQRDAENLAHASSAQRV